MFLKAITNGFLFLCLIACINGAPYTKYGRSCDDIGCPSTQVCVMTQDSCSYGQRDGIDCGRYPTCIRKENKYNNPQQNNNGDWQGKENMDQLMNNKIKSRSSYIYPSMLYTTFGLICLITFQLLP